MSYDSDVAAATSGYGSDADWDKIIKLCDRIRESFGPTAMGSALGAVMRRVKHTDHNIQLQALTLLEACVSNCGKDFQQELTKSSFHAQVREVLFNRAMSPKAIQMMKGILLTWSTDYRSDRAMSGLVKFVDQLISEGVIVSQGSGGGAPSHAPTATASSEEDEIQRAIRLSLEEAKSTNNSSVSMYPSFSPPEAKKTGGRKVRALYDFEAVEDNELTFKAGEIITVTNDSDDKWWRGETQLGSGLFPVNFVSTDLNASPEPVVKAKTTGSGSTTVANPAKAVVINEAQVDLLLEMLKTADITSTNEEENKTLKDLEAECTRMKILVTKEIENHQKQLDEMTEVSEKLQESFQLYRRLLQEGPRISEKTSTITPSHYPPQTHEVPPPYQSMDGSYFAPPPPPDGGFQTLPPLGYTQSYVPPLSGGGYNPASVPAHYHHPASQPPMQIPGSYSGPPPPQPVYHNPWGAPAGGNPQLSTSPGSYYPPATAMTGHLM